MNCDPLASVYRWIEYAAFGSRLERHRFHFLKSAVGSKKALLLGDGDGRFLAALLKANAEVRVDSLELSAKMIAVAKRRVRNQARVQWMQGDARNISFPNDQYDLIVTNFFLDCFSSDDVQALARRIRAAATPGARWIISEFRQPTKGWQAWHAKLWLRAMYLFFSAATRLKTRQLPDYREAIAAQGFGLLNEKVSVAGLIGSELWLHE